MKTLALFLLLIVIAAQRTSSQTIPEEYTSQDPTLLKPVTLSMPRTCIGELLLEISKQTGLKLASDDNDGAADIEISAFSKSAPVIRVLDSLWALVSYKRAQWKWVRSDNPKEFVYTLTRTGAAKRLAEELRRDVQRLFERQVDLMLAAASLPTDQRKRFLATNCRDMFGDDPEKLTQIAKFERTWDGLRTFGEALQGAKRAEVLRGDTKLTLGLADLSPSGRAFVNSTWQHDTVNATERNRDGTYGPVPAPNSITLSASRTGADVSPTLYIEIDRIGGYSYVGGVPLNRAVRRALDDRWMLEGDLPDDPVSTEVIKATTLIRVDDNTLYPAYLHAITESTSLTVLARLPVTEPQQIPHPSGKSIADYLKLLHGDYRGLSIKWRHGTILVSNPTWFWEDVVPPPWRLTNSLLSEYNSVGELSLDTIGMAASSLSKQQLVRLGNRIPVLKNIADWRPLFAILSSPTDEKQKILSPDGLAFSSSLMRSFSSEPSLVNRLHARFAKAVRISVTRPESATPGDVRYTISVRTPEDNWAPVAGFLQHRSIAK